MEYKKESCISKLEGKKCLVLWCSDGWRYNMETLKRQRFSFSSINTYFIEEEIFTKSCFSDILFYEFIEIIFISNEKKIWIEKGLTFEEKFIEV